MYGFGSVPQGQSKSVNMSLILLEQLTEIRQVVEKANVRFTSGQDADGKEAIVEAERMISDMLEVITEIRK